MEPSDAEIIEDVLAGNRARFGVLVERHGRELLGFLARRTRGSDEARELFQETWVRAFEGLAKLRDVAAVRGWLLGIASNTLRKTRRRSVPEALAEAEIAAVREPDALERSDRAARIARAVARLPERQREVFELRAVHELAHEEIAERLGISAESSRANFYQAARRLRVELEDEWLA